MVLKSIHVVIQRSVVFALTGARDSFVRVVHSGSCRFLLLDIEVAFSYLLLPTVLLQETLREKRPAAQVQSFSKASPQKGKCWLVEYAHFQLG